jgi:ATP-dependent HslUV protease ATP-binding subunit HslU
MRDEVMPKNILMIGPTGVGKTEIARRLAKLVNAPFIKVEATKYTETGFHGKDVDSIIQDLVEQALTLIRSRKRLQLKKQIERNVEKRILEALIGKTTDKRRRATFREHYRMGALDEQLVYMEVPVKEPEMTNTSPSGITINLSQMMLQRKGQNATEKRKMKVSECRSLVEEMETEKLVNTDDVVKEALEAVQQDGIVFLDEIDKICSSGDRYSADASAEGVQRDLLPLIEGSTISTKHGNVETDHILFIASGAFHSVKPSDLLAELQGRLPIRVHLTALTQGDFYRILTEPENNLIKQQQLLMATEGVTVQFKDEAVKELAKVAFDVNSTVENIGARRLHTVIERVMEEVSFDATTKSGTTFEVNEQYVRDRVSEMLKAKDLKRFLL